ncbi:MAG: hypothetical protein WC136_01235 [Sphaerochaeta sp.]
MIFSKNGYDPLKTVVVGRELNIPKRISDFTFKHFYKSNLKQSVYDKLKTLDDCYYVNYDLIQKRNHDLDNLADILTKQNILVHRPDQINQVIPFKTPSFKSELSSASNVRDVTLVLQDKIIETPTYVLNRYFENISLYNVYNKEYDFGRGGQWIRCPHTTLNEQTIDLDDWEIPRDFENIKNDTNYTMAIDGAQFLRLDDDVIVNISTYNHYLGYLWVKSFFPDLNFHMVTIADNHIDGSLVALRPGTFLVNWKHDVNDLKSKLPKKFQSWEFIKPTKFHLQKNYPIQIASERGMDINILSVDHNTVVVNKEAIGVIEELDKRHFNIIEVELDHCEIFGGGIHCSTLDILRESNG